MKKPDKKEVDGYAHDCNYICDGCHQAGRNQAIYEYEKFLPSEKEILELIKKVCNNWAWEIVYSKKSNDPFLKLSVMEAQAISKRLKGVVKWK